MGAFIIALSLCGNAAFACGGSSVKSDLVSKESTSQPQPDTTESGNS